MIIPALDCRGFGYGSGVIDPDHRRFILNIPKNASSFMLAWTGHHGWRAALLDHYPDVIEIIMILRDPIERWLSGMAQYIRTYILSVHGPNGPIFPGEPITPHDYVMPMEIFYQQYNDLVERLIFDVADRFDDHVWPQHELIPDVADHVQKTFFFLEHDLDVRMGAYLGLNLLQGLDRNRGDSAPDTADIQSFLRRRLEIRPELKDRLRKRYSKDYELLDTIRHVH